MSGYKPQNQLLLSAWPHGRVRSHGVPLNALLDSGADKSCISDQFAEAIDATIESTDEKMTTIIGQKLSIRGVAKMMISWRTPSGLTSFGKMTCYVVKDLHIGMVICEGHIVKLGLQERPSFLAPIVLVKRSKQVKLDDAAKSEQIAKANRALEERAAQQRKDARAQLEQIPLKDNSQNHKTRLGIDTSARSSYELVGGSSTTASSYRSSLKGFDRSTSTTPTTDRSNSSAGSHK
jgi:hypothetical protein